MNDRGSNHGHESELPLPEPQIHRARLAIVLIWLIPIFAAAVAGYYCVKIYQDRGPEIRITFRDASGVKTGETPLAVHGVRIGTVVAVDLTPDAGGAVLHVRMHRDALQVAKQGSIFWMVRPDISGGNINGLGTIISGPYIEGIGGKGPHETDFIGMERPPLMLGEGIRVILRAPRIQRLQLDTPVFYRGVQVGQVQDIRLGSDSRTVNLTLFIHRRYEKLLRSDSQFWTVKPAQLQGGLFSGVDFHLGSLRSLLGGGIVFATPDASAVSIPATDGTEYDLHDEPEKQWLAWSPAIKLPPPSTEPTADEEELHGLESTLRVK